MSKAKEPSWISVPNWIDEIYDRGLRTEDRAKNYSPNWKRYYGNAIKIGKWYYEKYLAKFASIEELHANYYSSTKAEDELFKKCKCRNAIESYYQAEDYAYFLYLRTHSVT